MTDLQLYNVPDALVCELEVQAQLRNSSVSDVVVDELTSAFGRRSRSDVLARLAKLPRVTLEDESVAASVRAERDARS